jgi:LuxR family transcriptional regulator, maltose regulon positive regulatory protein
MQIQHSSRQGCVVLTLAGRLDLPAAPRLQRAILKQLAQQPPAIICDLGQVEAIDPLCAGVFTAIRHPALGWPATALVLCGAQPAVADTLLKLGIPRYLAMYPSLDQALQHARARPPWLREKLALGPVPTAARDGRTFVRDVCGRWGLQGLADPAALLASELIALTVGRSRTAVELRVELVGTRLHVAVTDKDPDLLGLLVVKEETDQEHGLLVVDQVATAWGVRQDGAGGKTAWCTLDLPAQQSDIVGTDRSPSQAVGPQRPELVWGKLRPPALRAGLIQRAGLLSLLQTGLAAKLCLLDAPAGFGKTTLLGQWRMAAGGHRVAWVSMDEGDNDPTRLWVYVVEALRTVEPGVGAAALEALHRPSADLGRVVLPGLLNDLQAVGSQLFLVLDDYHLVTNLACHQTLNFFLERLPAGVHVAMSARADPQLPLARMRARGELAELRVAELRFTREEASALLNASMGLQLATEEVERLAERTEGWAAGLVLAGLSLDDRRDTDAFIASFQGDNRHIADYLTAEVLDRQPEEIQTFLLRTSLLERLSGPLCDAVLETEGSARVLGELERSNLFLVPLDDHREWYRYHQLFGELLRLELTSREPELVPVLHRRAAAWHGHAGDVEKAIYHMSAAGEFAEAGVLVASHWLGYWRRGRRATVARWLAWLPEEAIMADPPVAYVTAWIGGFSGASKEETERWLAATEEPTYEGPPPDGLNSLAFGAALTRAAVVFDDVGRAAQAARRACDLADPQPAPYWWMAQAALGQALYLSGRSGEPRSLLEELVARVQATRQPYAVITGFAVLSLLADDETDHQTATSLANRAAAIADAQGLSADPLCGIVHMALGRVLIRQGKLTEAQEQLEWALGLFGIDSMTVHRAHVLLLLAQLDHVRGDLPGARALLQRAQELTDRMADPGVLPALLHQTRQRLSSAPHQRVKTSAPLTTRELAVLRLLSTQLSTREISHELQVSVNTVRSQVRAIHRKLEVTSRTEAVARARQLGLLRGRE